MYTHYGVNVDIIQSEGSFRDRLISQNIAFQELPVVNTGYLVITYKNPQTIFALIRKQIRLGKLIEIVYINDSIPLDCCWENLIIDMVQQEKGYPPMKLKSRKSCITDIILISFRLPMLPYHRKKKTSFSSNIFHSLTESGCGQRMKTF